MQNLNLKLNFKNTLGIIFMCIILGLLVFKDNVFAMLIAENKEVAESQKASKEMADILLSLDKITLDTSVLKSNYLQALTTLPSFPVDSKTLANFGKQNPFFGNFIVVPDKATTSVGAIIYSNQRPANNGQSLRAVSPQRITTPRSVVLPRQGVR